MASERRPARPSPGGKGTVYGARQIPGGTRKVRQAPAKAEPAGPGRAAADALRRETGA